MAMTLANFTFERLEPGMTIFDLKDEVFGTIAVKDVEDPEWLMLEVDWDHESGVPDRSHVLSGHPIAVVIQQDSPMMDSIAEQMGDELAKVREEYGDDFTLLNMVEEW